MKGTYCVVCTFLSYHTTYRHSSYCRLNYKTVFLPICIKRNSTTTLKGRIIFYYKFYCLVR